MSNTALILAPHPDDEVLGCGGTMAKLAQEGWNVVVLIPTRGAKQLYSDEQVATVRREAKEVHDFLGVADTLFLDDFPAAYLDTVPQAEVNIALSKIVQEVKPNALYLPFLGDIHDDHQRFFHAGMVASRPNGNYAPERIYAYETLSETNWNAPLLTPGFIPNSFYDISETLEKKLEAMQMYGSQVRPFPNERSLESLRALAMLRGSTVGFHAAEAFVMVREIRKQ